MVVNFGLDLASRSVQIVLNTAKAKQRFVFLKHPTKPLANDVVMEGDWGYSPNTKAQHYSARHLRFLQTLGAAPAPYSYDIRLGPETPKVTPKGEGLLMVINSQSSAANKSLSLHWLQEFVQAVYTKHQQIRMQLLSASPALETDMQRMFNALSDRVTVTPFAPTVSPSLAIIQSADIVV
jgi:hypothetical protein